MPCTSRSRESCPSRAEPQPSPTMEPQKSLLNQPVSTAVAAAAQWIRRRRDVRWAPRKHVADEILTRLIEESAAGTLARRVVVVVAHPDDEAIGAGAVLGGVPNAIVVHVTDGAPADPEYTRRKVFESREAYAQARRTEVVAALGIIGIPAERIRGLGF